MCVGFAPEGAKNLEFEPWKQTFMQIDNNVFDQNMPSQMYPPKLYSMDYIVRPGRSK